MHDPTQLNNRAQVIERERDHWDHAVPPLTEVIADYDRGPDPWIGAIVDECTKLGGRTVVDFGCGTGLLAAHLAKRGFQVTAVDVSPVSLERARGLRDHAGLDFEIREVGLLDRPLPGDERADLLVGNNALHHLDLGVYAPLLLDVVADGGSAVFVESMATNPVLMFARRHLVGRFGVARFGTADEHPLTHDDLDDLGRRFGGIRRTLPEMVMFRLVDRQVLRGRAPAIGRALRGLDERLARHRRFDDLSFRSLLVLGPVRRGER